MRALPPTLSSPSVTETVFFLFADNFPVVVIQLVSCASVYLFLVAFGGCIVSSSKSLPLMRKRGCWLEPIPSVVGGHLYRFADTTIRRGTAGVVATGRVQNRSSGSAHEELICYVVMSTPDKTIGFLQQRRQHVQMTSLLVLSLHGCCGREIITRIFAHNRRGNEGAEVPLA